MAYTDYKHNGSVQCHDQPDMFLYYGVNDNGDYYVEVDKPGTGDFGYNWNLYVNDVLKISKGTSGDGKKWNSGGQTGNCGTSSFTVKCTCGAPTCTIAGSFGGSSAGYTVVSIGLHSHTAMSGTSLNVTARTSTSISLSWANNFGCYSNETKWYLKGGPYNDYTDFSGNDTPTEILLPFKNKNRVQENPVLCNFYIVLLGLPELSPIQTTAFLTVLFTPI